MKRIGFAVLLLSFQIRPCLAEEPKGFPGQPGLGVETMNIQPGLEDVFGLPTWRGALITYADALKKPEGMVPIDRLLIGHLIVRVNETPINSTEDFLRALTVLRPRTNVSVVVFSGSKRELLRIEVVEDPPLIYLPADVCPRESEAGRMFMLGIAAGAATAPTTEAFGQCPFRVPACTGMLLGGQGKERTKVYSGGTTFLIDGDWRRHTHISREACLIEASRIAQASTSDAVSR